MRCTRLQSERVGRLLGAEYAERGVVLAGLTGLEDELDDLEAALAAGTGREAGLPHRAGVLAVYRRLAERVLAAHREWIDEVRRKP